MAIQSPPAWIWDRLGIAGRSIGSVDPDWSVPVADGELPVRRIAMGDVMDALIEGHEDFHAGRTDVVFLCLFYPVIGFVLAWIASGADWLPLIFPLVSGFALIGPLAAVGLNEMSRRREMGRQVSWLDAFGVLHAPSLGAIAMMGTILVVIFLAWLAVANAIYYATMGPEPPTSLANFVYDLFHTAGGLKMIVLGCGVGFLFALLVLTVSIVSFPLLLDRKAGLETAIRTSIAAVRANPGPVVVWGLIVAVGLVLGSVPLFLGLVMVLPVLGHATWHLYRKIVPRP